MANQFYKSETCSQCGNPWEKPDLVNCRRCKQWELKRARTRRKKAEKAGELERKRKNKEWAATHCYICGSLMDNPDPKCYRCRERIKRREKWLERRAERMKPNDLNNLEGVRKFLQARRRRLNQDPHTPPSKESTHETPHHRATPNHHRRRARNSTDRLFSRRAHHRRRREHRQLYSHPRYVVGGCADRGIV
nr:MAG TPA: zinc-ribbon family protein [Caudoviricetes sp.]